MARGEMHLAVLSKRILNLGQMVVDKFTKLSKIGFPTECFTADFS